MCSIQVHHLERLLVDWAWSGLGSGHMIPTAHNIPTSSDFTHGQAKKTCCRSVLLAWYRYRNAKIFRYLWADPCTVDLVRIPLRLFREPSECLTYTRHIRCVLRYVYSRKAVRKQATLDIHSICVSGVFFCCSISPLSFLTQRFTTKTGILLYLGSHAIWCVFVKWKMFIWLPTLWSISYTIILQ